MSDRRIKQVGLHLSFSLEYLTTLRTINVLRCGLHDVLLFDVYNSIEPFDLAHFILAESSRNPRAICFKTVSVSWFTWGAAVAGIVIVGGFGFKSMLIV